MRHLSPAFCRSGVSRELSFAICGSEGGFDGPANAGVHPVYESRRSCRSGASPRRDISTVLRRAKVALLQGMFLLCLFSTFDASAETRAWLDRDGIAAGETATLNIETDQAAAPAPDYAPLLGDFELSGNTSSRQFEMINGVGRARVLYAVALRPRGGGSFTIPALRVGAERTQPLTLTVAGNAPAPARAGGTVFIEAEADAASPYVQQAVGYVVRLYYATSVLSGRLDQDPPEGASLQRVGEDIRYQRDIGGRRYTVVERRYLLTPERSGELVIAGARFAGQGLGGFFDDLFGDGRRELSARGTPRTLRVRPMPANAPQPWLPLRGLQLRYLSTPQSARTGEAAEVAIELEADGASATQVPELRLGDIDGAQVFAETPQIDERFEQGRPRVRVVREFSIVPARAGTLRVPAPRIEWWDANAGAARTASLPDFALVVTPGAVDARAGEDADASPAARGGRAQRWIEVPFVQGAVHPWALAALAFALLWLVTLWWALHRRLQAAPAPVRAHDRAGRASHAPPARLAPALATGRLDHIADALCASAAPPAQDLDAVCERLNDPAQVAAVRALQQARWGQGDAAATLDALRRAFGKGPHWRKTPPPRETLLPPLYPR